MGMHDIVVDIRTAIAVNPGEPGCTVIQICKNFLLVGEAGHGIQCRKNGMGSWVDGDRIGWKGSSCAAVVGGKTKSDDVGAGQRIGMGGRGTRGCATITERPVEYRNRILGYCTERGMHIGTIHG